MSIFLKIQYIDIILSGFMGLEDYTVGGGTLYGKEKKIMNEN